MVLGLIQPHIKPGAGSFSGFRSLIAIFFSYKLSTQNSSKKGRKFREFGQSLIQILTGGNLNLNILRF